MRSYERIEEKKKKKMKENLDKLLEGRFLLNSLSEQIDPNDLQYKNLEAVQKWTEKNEASFISIFGIPATFVFSITFFYNTFFTPGHEYETLNETIPNGCKSIKETTKVSLDYGKSGKLETKLERLRDAPFNDDVTIFEGSSMFFSELASKLTGTLFEFPEDEKFKSPLMEAILWFTGKV